MVKPRFYVESQIIFSEKIPTYLVSGSTIQHCIIPSVKEQLFFYPVLDLFCRGGGGRTNSFIRVGVNVKAV